MSVTSWTRQAYVADVSKYIMAGSADTGETAQQHATGIISIVVVVVVIIKISRAPIYRTRWELRAFYNNTNNTHTRPHARPPAHTHTHTTARRTRG